MKARPPQEQEMQDVLVGEQLSSVEFVQDYVQLRFDGPCLNAVTQPTVTSGGITYSWSSPGFRDALCALITKRVARVRLLPEDCLRIGFEGGSEVAVSLKAEQRRGEEAVQFSHGTKFIIL